MRRGPLQPAGTSRVQHRAALASPHRGPRSPHRQHLTTNIQYRSNHDNERGLGFFLFWFEGLGFGVFLGGGGVCFVEGWFVCLFFTQSLYKRGLKLFQVSHLLMFLNDLVLFINHVLPLRCSFVCGAFTDSFKNPACHTEGKVKETTNKHYFFSPSDFFQE